MTRLAFVILIIPALIQAQNQDIPFVGTPEEVVDAMLDLANVTTGDYLIDLGSGDGRIVIAAAKRGAVGHGVEIDTELVELSKKRAKEAGVENRVMFLAEDIFDTDFSMASVITIYMSRQINIDLRPDFFRQLEPGTRIVSHIFDMGDWKPDKTSKLGYHTIYLWTIPADVQGEWRWTLGEETVQLNLQQTFQEITDASIQAESDLVIEDVNIHGDRFTLILDNPEHEFHSIYNGRVSGDSIKGTVQFFDGENIQTKIWNAERK